MKMKKKQGLFIALIAVIAIGFAGLSLTACGGDDCTSHTWGAWNETTAPTCIATGTGTRVCTNCGATDPNTTIPINPDNHDFSNNAEECRREGCDVDNPTYKSNEVAAPTADLVEGLVAIGAKVTLSTTTAAATIYYTTDNSVPTAGSTEYTGSIDVDEDMTIKAIAVKPGMTDSNVLTAVYTVPAYTYDSTTYTFAQSNMFFYGYYQGVVNGVWLRLRDVDEEWYLGFEMLVEQPNERLLAGTYTLNEDYDTPITFGHGRIEPTIGNTFIELVSGTVEVSISGTGDTAIYTIVVDCTFENSKTATGTYKGTLIWEDLSN